MTPKAKGKKKATGVGYKGILKWSGVHSTYIQPLVSSMYWTPMHSPSSYMGAWGLPVLSPVNKVPGELPIDCDFVLEFAGHRDWHLTLPWQRCGQELTLSPELRDEQRSEWPVFRVWCKSLTTRGNGAYFHWLFHFVLFSATRCGTTQKKNILGLFCKWEDQRSILNHNLS